MKNIITLILFAIATTANTQTIVQDSSWMTNSAGIFTVHRLQTYDNGNTTLTSTKVGDTTAVVQGAINVYRSAAASMASDAILLSANGAKIREIIRQDELLKTQIGNSALNAIAAQIDTTQNSAKKYFTQSGWTLRDGSTTTAIVFSFATATGNFRYKLGTETIKLAYCLGNTLRILNYLGSGRPLDFYRTPSGAWVTIDLQQRLVPPAAALR